MGDEVGEEGVRLCRVLRVLLRILDFKSDEKLWRGVILFYLYLRIILVFEWKKDFREEE